MSFRPAHGFLHEQHPLPSRSPCACWRATILLGLAAPSQLNFDSLDGPAVSSPDHETGDRIIRVDWPSNLPPSAWKFRASGGLGAFSLVFTLSALGVTAAGVPSGQLVLGAIAAVASGLAALNYASQALFTRWWLEPLHLDDSDVSGLFRRSFRQHAKWAVGWSLVGLLLGSCLALLARGAV